MTAFYQKYDKFFLSVDCIIFGLKNGILKLLVQKRPYEPGLGQMSLIGGFVERHESVDEAAQRVLRDFTGLNQVYMNQLGAFGDVERDPGERVITVGYYALINADDFDDRIVRENDAQWVSINDVPKLFSDHNIIVEKARQSLIQNLEQESQIGQNLLPERFTLSQIQNLYEAILGTQLDKRNFRRTILEKNNIINTGLVDRSTSRRGAALYSFDNSTKDFNNRPSNNDDEDDDAVFNTIYY